MCLGYVGPKVLGGIDKNFQLQPHSYWGGGPRIPLLRRLQSRLLSAYPENRALCLLCPSDWDKYRIIPNSQTV